MPDPQPVFERLETLQARLDQVNKAWSAGDHEGLIRFFVAVLPGLLNARRCGIHYHAPGQERLWRRCATGAPGGPVEPPEDDGIVGIALARRATVIRNDGGMASICMPIVSLVGSEPMGAVEVGERREGGSFTADDEPVLREVVRYLAFALEVTVLNRDILEISNQVRDDMELFRQERFENIKIVTKSQKMRDLLNLVHKVSRVPVNVFISGESGTGKEVIAQIIHRSSERRLGPFVAVNCSSIPEHLMESEFFGHEKGAFTGAYSSRIGRFEEAGGGTLFLDEIADMPPAIQPKFLRALQEGEGARVGSNQVRKYDFRLVSASHRPLREEVEQGRFREDLFFRLFSVEIAVPPLRERRDDIEPLSRTFLEETSRRFKKNIRGFAPATLDLFEAYDWPGNVRQLQHEIERLVALASEGGLLEVEHCSKRLQNQAVGTILGPEPSSFSLAENRMLMEANLIRLALERTGDNRVQAARLLGITRQSLHGKIRLYGLKER
ncbi:MAG: sigma-54-dependent Fis family transcriptional regulator [Magnetococcales bacterium]|nr:sigma-54-dependent Fis family transcriptional regulator [Magnetococcales bacterium]